MLGTSTRTPSRPHASHRLGDPLDLSALSRPELRLLEQLAAGWELDAIAQRNGWSRRRARSELDAVLKSVGLTGDSESARRAVCSALRSTSDDGDR